MLDLSNGPLLVEVPPKVLGAINDRGGYNLMNTTKALFSELLYNFRSERWNEFELPKLSLRELQALAKLLGCPSYGTKEMLVIRLLAQRELHFKLARFTDNPDELASSYWRESLRDMCREARIWAQATNALFRQDSSIGATDAAGR
jgi:hypothetical protein